MINETEKDGKPEVIYTKQELAWYIAKMHLDGFYHNGTLMKDKTFCKLLKRLDDYIIDKLSPIDDGDIRDAYVVLEQTVGNP